MDLHSTNGSYMDGRHQPRNARRRSRVVDGDRRPVPAWGQRGGYRTPEAAAAIDFGEYRFVRCYIERRIAPQLTLRQVDPLIRELTQYRGLINT